MNCLRTNLLRGLRGTGEGRAKTLPISSTRGILGGPGLLKANQNQALYSLAKQSQIQRLFFFFKKVNVHPSIHPSIHSNIFHSLLLWRRKQSQTEEVNDLFAQLPEGYTSYLAYIPYAHHSSHVKDTERFGKGKDLTICHRNAHLVLYLISHLSCSQLERDPSSVWNLNSRVGSPCALIINLWWQQFHGTTLGRVNCTQLHRGNRLNGCVPKVTLAGLHSPRFTREKPRLSQSQPTQPEEVKLSGSYTPPNHSSSHGDWHTPTGVFRSKWPNAQSRELSQAQTPPPGGQDTMAGALCSVTI